MKKEDLYREIGLIDVNLVEAAQHSGRMKKKRSISRRWAILVACLVLYSSTATLLLAKDYIKNQNTEPYIRYLTAESMELQSPVTEFDANKFFKALSSENNESIYIAINRLAETFNDSKLREKALHEIEPFVQDGNPKIADAAAFVTAILSKSYDSPYIIELADGSKIFTLFNNYSDYGSQNVIWRIQNNELEKYMSFTMPSMYITDIIPSPNKKLIAVVTNSNKSDFVEVINVEEGMTSPELIESARVKYGAQKQFDMWIRTDHENYSSLTSIAWEDNDTLKFEASLPYEDMSIIETVTVAYQFSTRVMEVSY